MTEVFNVSKLPGLMLLFLLVGACAVSQSVPEDRFYRLEPLQPQVSMASPALRGGLRVDNIQADPLHSGRAVIYRDYDGPLQLRRYHYEFWVDQPPRLLDRLLLSYLRNSRVADRIIGPAGFATVAYHLQLRMLKFEQVRKQQSSTVEVSLQATLSSVPVGTILWIHTYTQQQSVTGRQMEAFAQAMQRAVEKLFVALQVDLAASLAGGA